MQQLASPDESAAAGWERTLYAFFAEKERRSGSRRTVQSWPSRTAADISARRAPSQPPTQPQGCPAYAGFAVCCLTRLAMNPHQSFFNRRLPQSLD